ncbi:zinc metalloproteinase-disintegrin-like MTP4 [Anopheles coustani]|uniref:zinc metalloproteinase-disintegrin-like MTP4 n=1 Tax=Anopheles coustani TaxID=139045 RepID=UPI002659B743|nr:zinc metalloproteinase-disintegrin-like MTP4 [Anopheles coustani]
MVATYEDDAVLNPIYPLLMPSDKKDTATLTYSHQGKATVLELIRSQGGPTTGGCEQYRERSSDLDHIELTNCDGRIRATLERSEGTFQIQFDESSGVHFLRRLQIPNRHPSVKRRTRRNHFTTIKGPYQANRHSRYVELLLVVDNSLYRKLNRNEWHVKEYCASLVNHINMLYNPLNIFIALTEIVIWSEKDQINVSQRAEDTLKDFLDHRARVLLNKYPHDHAQLLTTVEFRENVIGKAKVGGMCSDQSSGAIVRIHTETLGVQASTLAHEMGHSFSMEHDEDANCTCPAKRCVMTHSVTGLPLQHWSNCSVEQLAMGFSRGLHHCLRNRPSQLAVASCGNGFVEAGEECDCGLEEACENHCCDAATCRLREEAECATGDCCDLATCQLREAAIPCRVERGECDLPEYCTGRSEYCPPDVHRRDTEVCAGGEAYCVGGQCRTRTEQCRALWGPSGRAASESCYASNSHGTKYGNCGYQGRPVESYRKCDTADVLCGVLFCHHHKQEEELELGVYNGDQRHNVRKGNETKRYVVCHAAYVDLGPDQRGQIPAFVPDGAPCGDGKMCYRQHCETIERLNARGLGGKHCTHNCYGRGVCNSEGHCHCDPGFDPPYCEHAGVGGSLDSGPASSGPGPLWHLLTVSVLVVLVSILLLVLMVLYARSRQCPSAAACTRWNRRPWRLYKVRGTSPREPVNAASIQHNHNIHLIRGSTMVRREISQPKYHSSTCDVSDDQQYRPILTTVLRLAPVPPPIPAPTRVLPVPKPIGNASPGEETFVLEEKVKCTPNGDKMAQC